MHVHVHASHILFVSPLKQNWNIIYAKHIYLYPPKMSSTSQNTVVLDLDEEHKACNMFSCWLLNKPLSVAMAKTVAIQASMATNRAK